MNPELLRCSPLFAGMSDEDLGQLVKESEVISIKAGDVLIEQGAPGEAAFVVLDGEHEVRVKSGMQDIPVDIRGKGDVLGEMALLSREPRTATVRALSDSTLLRIPPDAFEHLLSLSPSARMAVLQTVITRLRHVESLLLQQEKMASLGTLSAGLAHELNNPASAVRRSAAQMGESLAEWQWLSYQLATLAVRSGLSGWFEQANAEILRRATSTAKLDPLQRLDLTDRLQEWLEEHNVGSAWELAPALAMFGWDMPSLEKLTENAALSENGMEAENILRWVSASSSIYALLDEIRVGAERISELVKAVKSYTYLDQAPIQDVDVHEGLENTLTILQSKLKGGVTIHRHYSTSLPHIEAYASELNQVWTNLIDNAIDAMQGQGELNLRTYAQGGEVVVEIADSGPGIPTDIQSRIFDPFFTTKPPGLGTGLGLHIAYNIVVVRHRGRITVHSQPGETCFQIILPTKLHES